MRQSILTLEEVLISPASVEKEMKASRKELEPVREAMPSEVQVLTVSKDL